MWGMKQSRGMTLCRYYLLIHTELQPKINEMLSTSYTLQNDIEGFPFTVIEGPIDDALPMSSEFILLSMIKFSQLFMQDLQTFLISSVPPCDVGCSSQDFEFSALPL